MQRTFQIKASGNCRVIEPNFSTGGPGRAGTHLAGLQAEASCLFPAFWTPGGNRAHSKMPQKNQGADVRTPPLTHTLILGCVNLGSDYPEEDEERIILYELCRDEIPLTASLLTYGPTKRAIGSQNSQMEQLFRDLLYWPSILSYLFSPTTHNIRKINIQLIAFWLIFQAERRPHCWHHQCVQRWRPACMSNKVESSGCLYHQSQLPPSGPCAFPQWCFAKCGNSSTKPQNPLAWHSSFWNWTGVRLKASLLWVALSGFLKRNIWRSLLVSQNSQIGLTYSEVFWNLRTSSWAVLLKQQWQPIDGS